ncbi:MAG: bifunctional [glutamate--ammonia ligase]-adenylyl-L-tyrosine phosphorylase/[glutamate--ammonia-ligase] adenylyltransferase [Betaproteobacteria bacterium]
MDIERALRFSHYAGRLLSARPAMRDELVASVGEPFAMADALAALAPFIDALDAGALASQLRQLRRRVMLHTLVRDLTGVAGLPEVFGAMTSLADGTVDAALRLHHRDLAATFGEPRAAADGTPQSLNVVALGKLGGGELNVSSDIDLVFVYADEGETDGARRIANREFFDRLGRRVIAALNDATADGFVFRVDMRLRPYGESGPLTMPFAALEQYLVTQGRTWERYAWLKARVLTGTRRDELDALIAPFVYRKYLDFDAYDGLRDVHRQIREQARRATHGDDIKLGPGGIREIEFTVQALQLVRAGRDPGLRLRSTVAALDAIGTRGLMPASAIAELGDAYAFLRRLEHRLQYRDDQQTQRLPADADEIDAVADACGFASAKPWRAELDRHRGNVDTWFGAVFDTQDGETDADAALAGVWDAPQAEAQRALLAAAGYADPDALVAMLAATRASHRYTSLPATSRQRFDTLVPRLMSAAAENPGSAGAQAVFTRLLALLESVSKRSAYLALMIEHPPLLPRIAQLFGASAWAADYLSRHPMLLDELLDARTLLAASDWDDWRRELDAAMAAHPDDAEWQMDALRHFKHAQAFRLLVQDLAGALTIERLADHLSALADIILDAALRGCWRQVAGTDSPPPVFAIIAYGKLGGKELGYASDLDLVFVYDVADDDPQRDAAPARFARLAQRINTWLTSITPAGELYATDLRLRPDGAAGMACTSLTAFLRYQRQSAWTWEHQALTRARAAVGDARLCADFEAARVEILCAPRGIAALTRDVTDMRRRMHDGHPNRSERFDVKHDRGGMVDIEFIVQFLVLGHSHALPALTRNAGNIALLQMAADAKLIDTALALDVAAAYRDFRRVQHAQRMAGATQVRVDPAPYAGPRAQVDALWTAVFGAPWM